MKALNLMTCAVILVSGIAQAGATITLNGKLFSTTGDEYLIQTRKSIYHVKKNALTKEQVDRLLKPDQQVSLAVAPEAIGMVRPIKREPTSQKK
jgi:hypothetical protein